VRLEVLGQLKNIHLIGTRTRDLPVCSIVPQPTALPRAAGSICIKLTSLNGKTRTAYIRTSRSSGSRLSYTASLRRHVVTHNQELTHRKAVFCFSLLSCLAYSPTPMMRAIYSSETLFFFGLHGLTTKQ
jgi:hypothetical protein